MWSDDENAPGVVAVVGSINQDVSARVTALPVAGETVLASTILRGLGGKGANQAVAAARVGAKVRLIAVVGADVAGDQLLGRLGACGVDVVGVDRREGASTGSAFITVDGRGENAIVVDRAANELLDPRTVREALLRGGRADVVLCQGEIPPACISEAADCARELGARFVLNLAPVIDVTAQALASADPLVVNEGEAAHLARALSLTAAGSSPAHLAQALAQHAAMSVVLTLGSDGAIIVEGHQATPILQPAFPATAVDTTGAGDSFVGVLCAALAEGAALLEAARRGAAAAALSVQRHGAADSYASRHTISLLLDAGRIA